MSALEWRVSASLAALYGLRMLGLFIVLPVFALFAAHMPGGDNRALVGLALGSYGVTQAILQVPMGWLSDRYGRKPVIYVGLLLFALGSFVAANAHSLEWIAIGRILQGTGAISGAIIALAADLTREQHRTKSMALIGATIGLSFAISIVLAPALDRVVGVPGIFTLTGILALAAILLVAFAIPTPATAAHTDAEAKPAQIRAVLRNPDLMRVNLGIFLLHAVLTAMFLVVPFSLRDLGLPVDHHWTVYLPVTLASFVLMIPAVLTGERGNRMKIVFMVSIAGLALSQFILHFATASLSGIVAALALFFTVFNVLEATLPSIISRIAPAGSKGTATGIYSSLQFVGTFCGAAGGGALVQHYGPQPLFLVTGAMVLVWLAIAATMRMPAPARVKAYPLPSGFDANRLSRELSSVPGVLEAVIIAAESVAYVKVDRHEFDEQGVMRLIYGG